jgi:hypothetical protein
VLQDLRCAKWFLAVLDSERSEQGIGRARNQVQQIEVARTRF